MLRLALLAALAAFLAWGPGAAAAQTTPLFPGATYERTVEFTPHGPVAIHVVRGPRPVGLYRLSPVLSNESMVGRETVSAMQRRLATQATSVGVNGDFFAVADGRAERHPPERRRARVTAEPVSFQRRDQRSTGSSTCAG